MVNGMPEPLFQCPAQCLTVDTMEVMFFCPWLDGGAWPNRGGVLDQPATFVEAATLIKSEVARLESEKAEDEVRKAERDRWRHQTSQSSSARGTPPQPR